MLKHVYSCGAKVMFRSLIYVMWIILTVIAAFNQVGLERTIKSFLVNWLNISDKRETNVTAKAI